MTAYLEIEDALQVVERYGFHIRDIALLASALAGRQQHSWAWKRIRSGRPRGEEPQPLDAGCGCWREAFDAENRGCGQCPRTGLRIESYIGPIGPDSGSSPTSGTWVPCSGACEPLGADKLSLMAPLGGLFAAGVVAGRFLSWFLVAVWVVWGSPSAAVSRPSSSFVLI